ncbi:MAG: TRAP-type mannitol/chloroaromatic compound transport system permease small subunit [Desulforhopalus sp.]|jgi:TRAP-type mannitol/chloroaromatic compound transport system permease small subunit
MLIKAEQFFMRINRILGKILSIVLMLMALNVFFDVIMRYFFRNSSVGMQEMEWHLFSIVILFGISVALLDEGHVRVDFLYDRYPEKKKAAINIIGTIFFLLPLALLIFFGSFDFVKDAYDINEISEDPGGLPFRWVIKGMIPLAFLLLIYSSIGYTIKNINLYRRESGKQLTTAKEVGK